MNLNAADVLFSSATFCHYFVIWHFKPSHIPERSHYLQKGVRPFTVQIKVFFFTTRERKVQHQQFQQFHMTWERWYFNSNRFTTEQTLSTHEKCVTRPSNVVRLTRLADVLSVLFEDSSEEDASVSTLHLLNKLCELVPSTAQLAPLLSGLFFLFQ